MKFEKHVKLVIASAKKEIGIQKEELKSAKKELGENPVVAYEKGAITSAIRAEVWSGFYGKIIELAQGCTTADTFKAQLTHFQNSLITEIREKDYAQSGSKQQRQVNEIKASTLRTAYHIATGFISELAFVE